MRRVVVLACVVVCAAAVVVAQQTPLFRAGVDIVHLDVSVLNKDRRPVRGLTLADFTVLEDGKPQTIVAFTPVDIPDAPPPLPVGAPTWTRTVAPDVTTNALPEGRLFVMLFDDLMLPADPAIVDAAKRAAKSVIAHLSATDQMAVVFTGASGAAQNFTSDRVKLLAAVDQLKPGTVSYFMGWDTATPAALRNLPGLKSSIPDGPQFDSDAGLRTASMRTIEDVADALIGAPQHRKALVLIGTGVPVNPGSAAPVLASGAGKGMDIREANRHLAEGMSDLFRRMQRANITVYPIDPSGPGGIEFWIAGRLASLPAFGGAPKNGTGPATVDPTTGETDPPGGVPSIQDLAHFTARMDFDFLETLASNTGGRALVNTNDFEPGIAQIFQENGSYYLMGIQANDPGSGKMHRLSVKVDRPDVEVRTRSGYYASEPEPKTSSKTNPSAIAIAGAIAGVLPSTDVPMHVSLAPFATPGKKTATVAIVLGISQPPPKDPTKVTVTLQTNAFTADGVGKASQQQFARVAMFGGRATDVARYEVLSRIDLPPGRYQLRLAAYSSTDLKTGSVYADVEVPDFASLPMSLSGVLLDVSPGLTAAPRDALATLVPIVPTAERTFNARDQVSAFVKIYERPKALPDPVTFTVRIVDVNGTSVFDKQETLDEQDFTGVARTVNKHIPLSLLACTPGAYLLTIEATMGKTAGRRDIRFTIK